MDEERISKAAELLKVASSLLTSPRPPLPQVSLPADSSRPSPMAIQPGRVSSTVPSCYRPVPAVPVGRPTSASQWQSQVTPTTGMIGATLNRARQMLAHDWAHSRLNNQERLRASQPQRQVSTSSKSREKAIEFALIKGKKGVLGNVRSFFVIS